MIFASYLLVKPYDTPMPSIGAWRLDFLGLLSHVSVNLLFGQSLTYASDKIPCRPHFTAPILVFQPGKLFEKQGSWHPFQYLHNTCDSNPRRGRDREMDVVRETVCLAEFYVIVARNGSENVFYFFLDMWFSKYVLSVFCTPGYVVPEVVSGMACMFYLRHML